MSEKAPLLLPAAGKGHHDGCPGCAQERKLQMNKGIPYREFFFVGVTTLASSLPITFLFPFLYFMVRDLKIAKSEEDIGFYAGFLGMVSFRVTLNSLFGLSTSFSFALTTRILLGILNGLLAPMKAYCIEVCRTEHQALGLSVVHTAWGMGLVIGPALGGYLAQPADKYPDYFSKMSAFGRFPYLLPSLVVSLFAAIVLVACIWLPVIPLWAVSDRKHGGLSFSSDDVGQVLAVAGASLLVYQLCFYQWVDKVIGTVNSTRIAAALSMVIVVTNPFMTYLTGVKLSVALYPALMTKSILSTTIGTGLSLLQNNAVPQEQRGAANGISTTAMSFLKAISPIGAGAL
ncbi:hypothetical protein EJB05_22361, partial [Eragrostis curvula]